MEADIALTNITPERTSTAAGTPQVTSQNAEHPARPGFSLAQADGGKDAWFFLAACFAVEALVWGFAFSFGIFQEFYSTHEPFSLEPNSIAAVGTTATGVMYMIGVALFPIYKKWPRLRNFSIYIGLPIVSLSLVTASFAGSVWHLTLTQGVLYGLGGSLSYYPALLFLDEWFVRRKGFAFGVMWAGTGTGGLIIPFIINAGLVRCGFRAMLRAWAAAVMVLSLPLVYLLRPRLPISPASQSPRLDFSFLSTSTFWLLQIGNIIEGLGYFIPSVYLPIFARSLGLNPSVGTVLLSLINTSSVLSAIIVGLLIDRFHVTSVIILSTIGSVMAVFLFWGLSSSLPLLCIFAFAYGLFAGGFSSTYTGVIKEIKKREESADVGVLIGLLSAGRGIGAVVSGPLSEFLLNSRPSQGTTSLGYGSSYGSLIVFTGITAAVGGLSFFGRILGWM